MTWLDAETGEMGFSLELPVSGPVYLVGDFNNWNVGATPMRLAQGVWEARLPLVSGAYRYGFWIKGAVFRDRHAVAQDLRHGWPWSVVVVPVLAGSSGDRSNPLRLSRPCLAGNQIVIEQ